MIVVFASEHDESAKWLVRRWESSGAELMVPSDLSRAGWCCTSRDPARSECVIAGVPRHTSGIDGVLMRRPAVLPADLPHIDTPGRNFVAAEMNAFLVYWLTASGRRVVNRPTPRSLCGPGWFPEHWLHYASKAGLRVRPIQRLVKLASSECFQWPEYNGPSVELTVAGQACHGNASRELKEKACRLAAAAGVELVRFRLDGTGPDACFLHADVCPQFDCESVEQAVLGYLQTGDWAESA